LVELLKDTILKGNVSAVLEKRTPYLQFRDKNVCDELYRLTCKKQQLIDTIGGTIVYIFKPKEGSRILYSKTWI
jgi:hypothetical protein